MKKTTVYMLLAVAGIVSLIFYGCSKPGSTKENPAYVPLDFKKVNLGDLHNDVVRKVYKRYNANLNRGPGTRLREAPVEVQATELHKTIVREQVIAELQATPIDVAVLGITEEQYHSAAVQIMDDLSANDFDIRNFPSPMCSQRVMAYVREILNIIEITSSLKEMNIAFDKVASKSEEELDGMEKDEVKGILEIARASAYLWSNENGSYTDPAVEVSARSMGGGKKILIADVSASAGFFMRMGIMGAVFASTPGSNVVILTGWALSAGISSACAALYADQQYLPEPVEENTPLK